MKRLLPYLSDYKKECILAPLFKMLEAIFELFVPLVVAGIIDIGIAESNRSYILSRGLILLLLALFGMAWAITAQWFAAKAATGFATKLRQEFFRHIESLSFSELDTVGVSTLITRSTSDINQAQNMVNMFLRLFLRSPFIVFGAVIMAFTVDAKAALIFAVAVPLLAVVVVLVMRLTLPLYKKVQQFLDRLTIASREALGGARVIRAFRREETEREAFEEKNDALLFLQLLSGRISAVTNPLTMVIVNLATIAILYTGGVRVLAGEMTQGQVVALVNYMAQILTELIKLANLIVTLTRGLASADRIADVLELRPSLTSPQSPRAAEGKQGEPKIVFSHVSLRYAGASGEALHDISFSVSPGETLGIIGGTGSGKSSVVQMIPRFYDAEQGEVFVDGVDVREQELSALRQKIGVVPQKALLFEGSVRENLCFGKRGASEEELWEALRIAQAEEFVREKEGGLDFHIEQKGANLSGGQRQRLTIARALLRKPEILILDDSMSALDTATDRALRQAISGMKSRPVTILVSQRVSTLRQCDRILVMNDGEVAGNGTHEELLRDCPLYQEIYRSQTEESDEA